MKKFLSFITSAVCICNCTFGVMQSVKNNNTVLAVSSVKGDVSGNGKVDLQDAIIIARNLLGLNTFTEDEKKIADYNGDSKIDLHDVIDISKYLLKKNIIPSTPTDSETKAKINKIVELCNAERAKKGIAPLTLNQTMTDAAMLRAKETFTLFSHSRPDGTSCFTVFDQFNIGWSNVAENIACGSATAEGTMNQWIHSEGHYANIMDPTLTEIGVGYYYSNSDYRYYWVQIFRHP